MAGYDGFSKSNNAIYAEEAGLLTASYAAKSLGVSTRAIEAFLEPAEWHHSSKFFNRVNYYNLADLPVGILEEMKKFTAEEKLAAASKKMHGTIEYLVWGGTRKHPKAEEHKFTGEVEIKGCFYYFDGIRKKIGSNGTYFFEEKNDN